MTNTTSKGRPEKHLDMSEREDFEAWAKTAGWSHYHVGHQSVSPFSSTSWEAYQAATKRSAERIASVEKIAEDAIELCTQQANRVMELEAQVEALREANDTFANNAIAKGAT